MGKILIVDDEKEIADLLELYLKNEGYETEKYYDGTAALLAVQNTNFDLAILDIMLPDIDGFALCRKIRKKFFYPIIMLTAKIGDLDKITGLTMGADDYITKPFQPLEVIARVKSQLRRYTSYNRGESDLTPKLSTIYDFHGLYINKDTHQCTLYDKELTLTPLEFAILWDLCEHKGNVVSAEELFERVWGECYIDCNNTVMTHIARIREKMQEPPRKPKFIKTVWGVGYKIDE